MVASPFLQLSYRVSSPLSFKKSAAGQFLGVMSRLDLALTRPSIRRGESIFDEGRLGRLSLGRPSSHNGRDYGRDNYPGLGYGRRPIYGPHLHGGRGLDTGLGLDYYALHRDRDLKALAPDLRRHGYSNRHYDDLYDRRGYDRYDCVRCRESNHHCDVEHGRCCDRDQSSCPCCCSCGSKSNSNCKKDYPFKTKDITVRGKSYAVRKSYLADSNKFEADLIKYADKKKEEQLPEHIIAMLIQFINEESCDYKTVFDLVLLNILAFTLGAKSACEYSMGQLKKLPYNHRMSSEQLTNICGTIILSAKVDDKLEEWLKTYLENDNNLRLLSSPHFEYLVEEHPEVYRKILALTGRIKEADDSQLAIL